MSNKQTSKPTGLKKRIALSQVKEKGESLIRSFILAQYDAFENRLEDPNQTLGKIDHDYYWEAVGVAVLLRHLGYPDNSFMGLLSDKIAKECLEECKKYGCKKAYFKNLGTEIDYGLTWYELVLESQKREDTNKPKPKSNLYTRIKNYFKPNESKRSN